MSNIGEIAMAIRLEGGTVKDYAKRVERRIYTVSQVINGHARNEHIEKQLIRDGFGYLLMKAQIQNGIHDRERYDRMVEEIKKEQQNPLNTPGSADDPSRSQPHLSEPPSFPNDSSEPGDPKNGGR
jgi:hypothetical protein